MSILKKPVISECGCFHIGASGNPLYEARFDEVLAFHKVGNRWIAPVKRGLKHFISIRMVTQFTFNDFSDVLAFIMDWLLLLMKMVGITSIQAGADFIRSAMNLPVTIRRIFAL